MPVDVHDDNVEPKPMSWEIIRLYKPCSSSPNAVGSRIEVYLPSALSLVPDRTALCAATSAWSRRCRSTHRERG